MRRIVVAATGLLAVCALPLLAQSAGNDTLGALLVEVRLLRQALERSATAPQVQLLGTRLTVQNARLQSAIHDHQTARVALEETTSAMAAFTRDLETTTQEHDRASDLDYRRRLAQQMSMLKEQLAAAGESEPRRRQRESELAAAVAEEQNQWLLLNRRLDEIERALPR